MTREGIHRLVDNHAEEVQPMLDRLATTYPPGHLDEAAAALTNAGRRFKWTSELEHALLAQLGHDVATGRPRPEHQRARTMNERRIRRLRGLACPDCSDTGWRIDPDDQDHAVTAHPCHCVSP